ncbi:hypothetical protein pb186bvf_001320 [Paramecium bursaria]
MIRNLFDDNYNTNQLIETYNNNIKNKFQKPIDRKERKNILELCLNGNQLRLFKRNVNNGLKKHVHMNKILKVRIIKSSLAQLSKMNKEITRMSLLSEQLLDKMKDDNLKLSSGFGSKTYRIFKTQLNNFYGFHNKIF